MSTAHNPAEGSFTRSKTLGSVAVVGAGISGLAAAYRLKHEGVDVTVFESDDISGGKIKSSLNDGITWEKGPNTMMESSLEVSKVLDGLQLRDKQQYPMMQSQRYIVRNSKPELVPSNPLAFCGSKLLSANAKTLTDALAENVGHKHFRFNSSILALACNQQGNPLRDSWKLSASSMAATESQFDAVIMTAPVSSFKEMQFTKDGMPYPLDFVPKVIYQPLSVMVMAFKKDDVKHPLDGFGVLVPSKEQKNGFQTLGTLFSSSMFPDRTLPDTILFTTFIGGSRNRDSASRPTKDLKEIAKQDLARLVGVQGQPVFVNHIYWDKAFPEYGPGYGAVLDSFKKLETDLPGFFYAGNHREGLAVGKALASGYNVAGHVLDYLQSSGGHKIYTMALANE